MGDPAPKVRDPLTALLRRDRVVLGGLAALTLFTAVERQWVGDAMMRTRRLCLSLPGPMGTRRGYIPSGNKPCSQQISSFLTSRLRDMKV